MAFSDIWFTLHTPPASKHNTNPDRPPQRSPKLLESHIGGRRTWFCKIVVDIRVRESSRPPRKGTSSCFTDRSPKPASVLHSLCTKKIRGDLPRLTTTFLKSTTKSYVPSTGFCSCRSKILGHAPSRRATPSAEMMREGPYFAGK